MKIAVKSGRSDLYGSTRSSSSREHASRPSSKRTSSRRTRGDRETDRLLDDDDDDSLKGQRRSESTLQYMAFIVIFLLLVNIVTIKAVQYARSLDPEAQEQIRTEWEQEVEEHRNRSGQMQEERETIEADYKTMRETRNKWNDEDSQWIDKQHEWNREDREWEEKKKHEVYLDQRWEERQRQEEDKRNAFHWNYPRSDGRCRGYGLREYEAALVFVGDGGGVDPLLGCVSTPIEIHGEEYQVPDYCEIKGSQVSWSGAPVEYIGHWTIGDESGCNTLKLAFLRAARPINLEYE
ncbi:hypothetical protein AX16_000593 [Volvariella volvacea WC 439]|nr:hypothetical protein AX16_000593 [Volvariella volvacea WC 439]